MAAIEQYGRLFRVTLRTGGHAEQSQRAWRANKRWWQELYKEYFCFKVGKPPRYHLYYLIMSAVIILHCLLF